MSVHFHRRFFTLTEVMIATVILALAVVGTAAIVSGAQASLVKAENRWSRQHLAANASEAYLMLGPHATPPAEIVPEGFSTSCELLIVDDIHEDAQEAIDGWLLGEYLIHVYDKNGNRMTETHIRKILKEEDFE